MNVLYYCHLQQLTAYTSETPGTPVRFSESDFWVDFATSCTLDAETGNSSQNGAALCTVPNATASLAPICSIFDERLLPIPVGRRINLKDWWVRAAAPSQKFTVAYSMNQKTPPAACAVGQMSNRIPLEAIPAGEVESNCLSPA